jgi:hypothetical protein
MRKAHWAAAITLSFALGLMAQDAGPSATITNGLVIARLHLPDAEHGYYRGTRFDWSGVIAILEYRGHSYFGQWFPIYDPKLHDSITGPVEEFRTGSSALGYAEAKSGETFVKIGVGVLRKPEEAAYSFRNPYEIVDGGKWTVNKHRDSVEFTHVVADPKTGYAYLYRKTVRLAARKPELILEHSLKNTGARVIQTSVYDHHFFFLDGDPTGPDFTVTFPFDLQTDREMTGLAAIRGRQIVYLKTLETGEIASTPLRGFGATSADYDFRIENKSRGTAVRVTADQPITRLLFWSIRTTLCPEAFMDMTIQPGGESHWRITYDFEAPPPPGR